MDRLPHRLRSVGRVGPAHGLLAAGFVILLGAAPAGAAPPFTPFVADLPVPAVLQPVPAFEPECELRPEWGAARTDSAPGVKMRESYAKTRARVAVLVALLLPLALPLLGCADARPGDRDPRSANAATVGRREDGKPSRARFEDEEGGARLPNVLLHTQDGKPVRFYDDLVQDRIVLINFMFTTCAGICPPMTANLVTVQILLGDRVGRDIFMLSVSLDPGRDTPAVLKAYAERHGVKPGWTFLTGRSEDVEMLRRRLGIYDPDPLVDADKTQHAGILTFGNDRTGRWAAVPVLIGARDIADTVRRITDPVTRRSSPVRGAGTAHLASR